MPGLDPGILFRGYKEDCRVKPGKGEKGYVVVRLERKTSSVALPPALG